MIVLKHICKEYDSINEKFHALNDITFTLEDGESMLISGKSGSGKSTLLGIIGTLIKPTSGFIEINGENMIAYSDIHLSKFRRDHLGYVTQSFDFFEEMSIEYNVALPLVLNNLTLGALDQKIDDVLRFVGLQNKREQNVLTLSGGEKQRVIIARALISEPKILLCDEPTANLDLENSLNFLKLLEQIQKSGTTVVVATHDPLLVDANIYDKKLELDHGSIK